MNDVFADDVRRPEDLLFLVCLTPELTKPSHGNQSEVLLGAVTFLANHEKQGHKY